MASEGATDREVFTTHVIRVLRPARRPGDFVIMDTLAFPTMPPQRSNTSAKPEWPQSSWTTTHQTSTPLRKFGASSRHCCVPQGSEPGKT